MRYLLLLLLASAAAAVQAQDLQVAPLRQYVTQAYMQKLAASAPELNAQQSAIERHTAQFRSYGSMDSVVLPVVFHLLPTKGEPITAEDVQAQMDRLNTDFFAPAHPYLQEEYQHPSPFLNLAGQIVGNQSDNQVYLSMADRKEGFAKQAANAQVRFCFPATDPNGLPTTGINLPQVQVQEWNMGPALKTTASGGQDAWDANGYINIWVARLPDSLSGFAQLPGGPAATDGIVIDDRLFARASGVGEYALGRTLCHLMGSYLNLYELWNDTRPCADDYVEDTPIHNGPNYKFPQYDYKHFSTCDGNTAEMTSNLMDNVPDSVQYLFTHGQAMRMQATVAEGGPRHKLRFTPLACAKGGGKGAQAIDERKRITEEQQVSNWAVRVSPNPVTSHFEINISTQAGATLSTDALQISIYNQTGGILWQQKTVAGQVPESQFIINSSAWSAGVYTVVCVWGKEIRQVRVVRD